MGILAQLLEYQVGQLPLAPITACFLSPAWTLTDTLGLSFSHWSNRLGLQRICPSKLLNLFPSWLLGASFICHYGLQVSLVVIGLDFSNCVWLGGSVCHVFLIQLSLAQSQCDFEWYLMTFEPQKYVLQAFFPCPLLELYLHEEEAVVAKNWSTPRLGKSALLMDLWV